MHRQGHCDMLVAEVLRPTFHMFPWVENLNVNGVQYIIKHELQGLWHAFILTSYLSCINFNLINNIYSRLNMLARCKFYFSVGFLYNSTAPIPDTSSLIRFFPPERFEFHAPKERFAVQEDWGKRPCPAKSKVDI